MPEVYRLKWGCSLDNQLTGLSNPALPPRGPANSRDRLQAVVIWSLLGCSGG